MNPFSYEDLPLDVSFQQKKILITVDLEKHSEQIIAYSLLVTQRLFCEYTVLHCVENGISMQLAQEKMARLLQNIDTKYSHFANRSIKSIVSNENPVSAIQELHRIHNYNCVMVGTSNQNDAWEMGIVSKSILLTIPATILVIPPNAEFNFPNNVSVLIEKRDKTSFDVLSAFNNFVSYDNIFINFVFFAKNKKIMKEEKALIEEYQGFFEANFTFTFIVEAIPTYMNFFKYIEETYCTAAVIPWNESSAFYQSLTATNFNSLPCSPKNPILYPKKRELF